MRRSIAGAASTALLATAFLLPGVGAQSPGASPATSPDPLASPGTGTGAGEPPHPAHIHSGTCAELGDIVAPLRNVAERGGGAGVTATIGGGTVEVSVSRMNLTIAQMVRNPHVINAHASEQELATTIACGAITGQRNVRNLVVQLDEQNGSGHRGVAFIQEDGDRTVVFTVLFSQDDATGQGVETPIASPPIGVDPGASPAIDPGTSPAVDPVAPPLSPSPAPAA